jgi:4-amino-4-deoxy-L-arabinose transferase-like glycosyltransferase
MMQATGVRAQGTERGSPSAGFWTARRYVCLLLALVAVHAVLAATLPVSGDEAYYWDCSRHPDWATYDQPPLMMLAPIPFRAVLGETRLAVRGPAILASFLIGLFMLPLARRLGGGPREAVWAYLVLHAAPLFFLGSFYASTDIGMMAGYVGATWAAVAIAQGERRAWWGFGVAVALGFLAKFPAVLVLPALVPALLRREVRAHLRTPVPYLAAALSGALTAPVWIWGARHDWVNLTFQLQQRHAPGGFTAVHVIEFLALSAGLASPPLAAAMAATWWKGWRRSDHAWSVLLVGAASPVVFFSYVALREPVAPHWSGPAVVLTAVALACTLPRPRWLIGAGIAFGLAVSLVAVLAVLLLPRIADGRWRFAGRWQGSVASLAAAATANDEIVAEVVRRLRPGEMMASESYTNVHLFAFLSGGTLPTRLAHVGGGVHGLASLYWYRPEELQGRDFLFVTTRDGMAARLSAVFSEVTEESPFVVERNGTIVRRISFVHCRDLRRPEGTFTHLPSHP